MGSNGEETDDLEVVKVAGGEDGNVAGGEVVGGATGWAGSRGEGMGESGWVSCDAGGVEAETGVW